MTSSNKESYYKLTRVTSSYFYKTKERLPIAARASLFRLLDYTVSCNDSIERITLQMPTVDVLDPAFHPSWCLGREFVNIADFPNLLGSGDAFGCAY